MKDLKVLNLYACLGGNRFKWNEVYPNIKVTAVELDPYLAELYKERFPDDEVIVGDAHQYLLEHFKEYDFIWSSPPCPTHRRCAYGSRKSDSSPHPVVYPDLTLYQEIILLDKYYTGKYCIENVIPFYTPLMPAQKRERHLFWTNFKLPKVLSTREQPVISGRNELRKLHKYHEYDFTKYKGSQRLDKIARNLVDYEAGKTIFQTAFNIHVDNNRQQLDIFQNLEA